MEKLWQIAGKINIGRERLKFGEPMSAHTTFGIGGPADLFAMPDRVQTLALLLEILREECIPLLILGGGANLLVGDRGIRGAVLDLGSLDGARRTASGIEAGAGLSVDRLCEQALALGLGGLENFYGMPGSVGGAICMNARCYEKDFSECLEWVELLDPAGNIWRAKPCPGDWGYKKSPLQPGGPWAGHVVTSAGFRLCDTDAPAAAAVMRSRREDRIAKGHYRYPSAGSMFKNNRAFGAPTGVILDRLGLRGMRIGDAAISPWHANIFINYGHARAADMKALAELAMDEALTAFGFALEPEVLFTGEF